MVVGISWVGVSMGVKRSDCGPYDQWGRGSGWE